MTTRRATVRIEPLAVGAAVALLVGLFLLGPTGAPNRGIWGSPYVLAVAVLCAVGPALIAWCATRYFRRALRTGQVLGRGGMVSRSASPVSFWATLLSAMWVFLFSGAFFAAVGLMMLWQAGVFR